MNPALAFLAAAQSGSPLTIDQALELAMGAAFGIRSVETQVGKAQAQLDQATSGVGLSISATAAYQRTEQSRPEQAFPSFQSGSNSQVVGLSVVQAIDISGSIEAAVVNARLNREAARRAVSSVQEAVKVQVRTLFFGSLQAREAAEIQAAAVKAAEARLENARIRVREGALPNFDVIRLEAELSRSRQDAIDAVRAYDRSRQSLNNALARPIETEFDPQPLPSLPPHAPDAGIMVQSAVAQRPDLQQAGLLVQALEAFRIVEQSGLKPSLAVSLNVQQAIAPNPGQSATQAFAAVQLSWPIRDGGATRARVRSAEEDIAAAEVALEQARLGAALEVRAAATEYLSARESHAVALAGESAAAEALRLADLRYREGVGILLDVISAQSELVRAQRSRSAAFHAAWAAYASLQKAVGADDLDRLAASEPARS